MPFRVISVEPTPNPNAMKFVLDRDCSAGTISFLNQDQAAGHPLAERLFAIRGVTSLLFLGDFITVNKSPNAGWHSIKPAVEQVLASAT
jgi:hypothetical protein